MMTLTPEIVQGMNKVALDVVSELTNNAEYLAEVCAEESTDFALFGSHAGGDRLEWYFEFESTSLSIDYNKAPPEVLARILMLPQLQERVPVMLGEALLEVRKMIGDELLEALNTTFEAKFQFTAANQEFFGDHPPFNKIHVICNTTIIDLDEEAKVRLLTVMQMIAFMLDLQCQYMAGLI